MTGCVVASFEVSDYINWPGVFVCVSTSILVTIVPATASPAAPGSDLASNSPHRLLVAVASVTATAEASASTVATVHPWCIWEEINSRKMTTVLASVTTGSATGVHSSTLCPVSSVGMMVEGADLAEMVPVSNVSGRPSASSLPSTSAAGAAAGATWYKKENADVAVDSAIRFVCFELL